MFSSNTSQVSSDAVFIEDTFSSYLYTGTGSTQTITNGIDLAGKGGMVWVKQRNAANNHALFDTSRGTNKLLYSNTTSAQVDSVASYSDYTLTSFNSNGFTLGNDPNLQVVNTSPNTYASWTFRKQPKFFDVVTFNQSGTSSGFQTVSHNLGSVPGCIIIKRISSTGQWYTYHRSTPNDYLILNSTAAATNTTLCQNLTSTTFDWNKGDFGQGDGTDYVAYLFAHNAGGFGLTGTDNVISCGSFTTDGSGNTPLQNLGFEPQFLMTKVVSTTGNWLIQDSMRGFVSSATGQRYLYPNLSNAESVATDGWQPTATGFQDVYASQGPGRTYIYIAIRRGPMKTPTSGTSVFVPVVQNTISNPVITTNFPVDLSINTYRSPGGSKWFADRLRGGSANATSGTYVELESTSTSAEITGTGAGIGFDSNTGIYDKWIQDANPIFWNFRRAPGFFDEVCYTGTGVSGLVVNHNLGVTPELLIYKNRATAGTNWFVLNSSSNYGNLNSDAAFGGPLSITLGSTSYTINTTGTSTNASGQTYVAYLFASCPGVSKVGSYTGNGSSQTINCGFTGGARFVMIKRTDSTGDWYVWDTARGIVSANDPRLSLNSTAAEVTTDDSIDPANSGFIVNQVSATNINVSSATYIYLAIA